MAVNARHRHVETVRGNRKARRAAKAQPGTPPIAVLPARAVGGAGYGRYVGRVGALAVALGLGAAVATGFGIGNPAVAWAEEGTSENANNDPPAHQDEANDPSAHQDEANDPSAHQDEANDPSAHQDEANDPSAHQDEANDPSAHENEEEAAELESLEAPNLGGNEASATNGDSPEVGITAEPPVVTTEMESITPGQDVLPDNGVALSGSNEKVITPKSGNLTPSAGAPGTPTVIPVPALPISSSFVAPFVDDPDAQVNQGDKHQLGDDLIEQSPGGQFDRRAMNDDVTAMSFKSASVPADTPAPAALVDQPDNALEALFGAPAILANIAMTAVSTFLSSLMNPGPEVPAPPVMLFVVVGWVQRELTRTFCNQNPNAVADPVTTAEDTDVMIPVLANDTDGDLGAGDVLTVTDYTQPANGTLVLNTDGTFTYSPIDNFNGTDTFSYTVSDKASPWHIHGLGGFFGGGHSDTATVSVTVDAVNDAPVAVDDPLTVTEDGTVTFTAAGLVSNDTDIDGDNLSAFVGQPNYGSLNVAPGGVYTYTPGPAAQELDTNETLADTFTYTVSDGNGGFDQANIVVTITGLNDAPEANSDASTCPRTPPAPPTTSSPTTPTSMPNH